MTPQSQAGRIRALDVLRGVAILGILLANITAFSSPLITSTFATVVPERDQVTALFDSFQMAFVNGKFRSMLAVLFGVGVWLQYRRRRDLDAAAELRGDVGGRLWPGGYLKRMGYLALLGLIHGYLLWYGDILFFYAVLATISVLFVKASDKALWWWVFGLSVNALLTVAVLVPLMMFFAATPGAGEFNLGDAWAVMSPAYETEAFQQGTYLQQLKFRLLWTTVMNAQSVLFLSFFIMPLFLLGILFGRSGVLARPSQHPKVRNLCLRIGFGVGLPLGALAFIPMSTKQAESMQALYEMFAGPVLAVGYLMLGAVLIERGALNFLWRPVERVGRVALSAYLMQTVLCTFIFYSWGLAYFGSTGPLGQLGAVAIVWAANIAFAYGWLAFFRMGPVEWAWRSLSESKVLPIRKGIESAAEAVTAPEPPPVASPSEEDAAGVPR
jgi:uncharacterized protein